MIKTEREKEEYYCQERQELKKEKDLQDEYSSNSNTLN